MKDNYGDRITVEVIDSCDPWVWVTFGAGDRSTEIAMGLSPKKARKLAAKILATADEAEGK